MERGECNPKCWICKDCGLVFYEQKIGNLSYEMAARCRCVKGQDLNESIALISYDFGEKIAKENLIKHRRLYF